MKSLMSVFRAFRRGFIHSLYVKQLKGACQELTFGGDPEQHYKLNKIGDCYPHGTSWGIAWPALVV